MTQAISRTTQVVSISLDPSVVATLDSVRETRGQSRSAFIQSLIKRYETDKRWDQIYAWGEKTARNMSALTEAEIDRILHEA